MHRHAVTQVDVGRNTPFSISILFVLLLLRAIIIRPPPPKWDYSRGISLSAGDWRTNQPTTSGPKNSRPSGRQKKKKTKKKNVLLERKATHIQTYLILERRERNGGIKGDDGDISKRKKCAIIHPQTFHIFGFSLSPRAGARPRWVIKNNKRLKVESPVLAMNI